jgi:hypothetical protein
LTIYILDVFTSASSADNSEPSQKEGRSSSGTFIVQIFVPYLHASCLFTLSIADDQDDDTIKARKRNGKQHGTWNELLLFYDSPRSLSTDLSQTLKGARAMFFTNLRNIWKGTSFVSCLVLLSHLFATALGHPDEKHAIWILSIAMPMKRKKRMSRKPKQLTARQHAKFFHTKQIPKEMCRAGKRDWRIEVDKKEDTMQ